MMRPDRQVHMDVGLKQQLLQLLLCFNPLWLRLALETVFGELLLLQSNSDVTAITQYIILRMLSNTELQRRYAHPSVPHSYGPGYEKAVKTFLLKKFLSLILFLDKAKTAKLIDHDPCLFRKDAPFKSSRDLLLEFSRHFLSGVGDFTKHLGYLGYTVHHQQTTLDEFDYAVTNLATDLRCGIRLSRVAEILHHSTVGTLSSKLRVPAVSRLQKVHNITVAVTLLQQCRGIQDSKTTLSQQFPPAEVVAGHRETTLGLLWALIFNAQLLSVLSLERLREEVRYLQRSLAVRAYFDSEAAAGRDQLQALLAEEAASASADGTHAPSEEGDGPETAVLLLKRWLQWICAHYGLLVYNLSVSLSDGRTLCLLLHHYHPELLCRTTVRMETTQNMQQARGVDLDVSADDSFSDFACADDASHAEQDQRILNEKANHALFAEKIRDLGGVPLLVRAGELVNTIPDEKVLVTFLALLCSRLLDLSAEIKAARTLQMAWRNKMMRRAAHRLKVKYDAAAPAQQ